MSNDVVRDIEMLIGGQLTPSEIVLLRGEMFARPARHSAKTRLPGSRQTVPLTEYAAGAHLAMLLTLRAAGAVRMRVIEKRGIESWTMKHRVLTEPVRRLSWPPESLEAKAQAALDSEITVNELLYRALAKTTTDGYTHTLDLIKDGLVERGLMTKEVKKILGFVVVSVEYGLTYQTAAAVRPDAAQRLSDLMTDCAQRQPDFHAILLKEIHYGISRRTTSSD